MQHQIRRFLPNGDIWRTRINQWIYPETDSSRDLRIDFLRGIVVLILIVIHIEVFSIYNLLVWERIGVVSGAEGFTIFSGVVLGMVYRKKIEKMGWYTASGFLFARGMQIYRVNVTIILVVTAISFISFLDPQSITSFTDRYSGKVYLLFPTTEAPLQHWLSRILLLKMGPHQTQVLGLYVVLLFFSPFALWMFSKGQTFTLLSISWILYMMNWETPMWPTGAQFEYGFPILTWQLVFFHGMAFGYYRKELATWFSGYKKTLLMSVSIILFFCFMFFSLNNPNPALPDWIKLSVIPEDIFNEIYVKYFRKNTLGVLRLLNYLVVLIILFQVLTYCWKPINKLLGWFFVPMGQATLYVFILHVFMCLLINNIPIYEGVLPSYFSGNIWVNTLGHTTVLMVLWWMVCKKICFRWIPR